MPRSLTESAYRQPGNKKFYVGESTITYGELLDKIERLSAFYESAGLAPGDRVLLAVKSPAHYSEIFLSLLVNGLTVVLADPKATTAELLKQLMQTDPIGLILDTDLRERLDIAAIEQAPNMLLEVAEKSGTGLLGRLLGKPRTENPTGVNTFPDILSEYEPRRPPENIDPVLPGWIVHSSGSTSNPKNIVASRRALLNTLECRSENYRLNETSRILNVLALSQGDGMGQGPLLAFFNGATLVRPVEFQASALPDILDSVYAHRVTHFVLVPVMLGLMVRMAESYRDCFATADFQMVVSTAAELPEPLWQAVERDFGVRVVNCYALAECTAALFNGPDDSSRRVGTLGKPYRCDTRIVPLDGETGSNRGELWLRGDSIMNEYLGNPAATAACIKDGWLATGDLVQVGAEGFFELVGRVKEMISFAGHSISPVEVAQVLAGHEGVNEVAVFGVSNVEWGEIIIAAVNTKPGESLTANELSGYARRFLSEYKIPRQFLFTDTLPRTKNGKFDLAALRALQQAQAATRPGGGDIKAQIISLAKEAFRSDRDIGPDDTPRTTQGWDSLAHMELVLAIEKQFSITFSTRDIMNIESIGWIINLVNTKIDTA